MDQMRAFVAGPDMGCHVTALDHISGNGHRLQSEWTIIVLARDIAFRCADNFLMHLKRRIGARIDLEHRCNRAVGGQSIDPGWRWSREACAAFRSGAAPDCSTWKTGQMGVRGG